MTSEHALRAELLERELLGLYSAASLSAIDARELETFRASTGVHVVDPAFKLLAARWEAAGPRREMNVEEIETWPDTNLHDLMVRSEVPLTTRQDAALELYRRTSKFCRTPEFAAFLTDCIDRELVERKAGHEPTRVLDALSRLNEKSEASRIALAGVDSVHTEAEKALLDALGRAMETLRTESHSQRETLHLAIAAVRTTVKRHALVLGSVTLLTALALALHLLHAF